MPGYLRQIIVYAVVILLQVILDNYVNLGPMIYVCLIPLLIVYLPLDQKPYISLIIAFGLGLLIDILADGVLGLNAGAATLVALVYRPIFYPVFQKNNYSKKYIPPISESGIWHHVLYMTIILAIYFAFYIAFDGLAVSTLLSSLLRYFLNIAVNLALVLIVDYTLFNKS